MSIRKHCRAQALTALVALLLAGLAQAALPQPDLSRSLVPVDPPIVAPDFELHDLDDRVHRLSNYRGKVVLINFWATWCPPCVREMPSMERLRLALGERGLVVLAIDQYETPDHVFAFLGQLDLYPEYPVLFDVDSKVADSWGVSGLPSSWLVDREGRIVYRALGGREFDHPQIRELVEQLLGPQPVDQPARGSDVHVAD